ncbi:cell division control protein 45 [Thraustotheca clavata]|uniref:Cell division control protein 45 n=1 Tax=Thraustotheca clavata TaxID=74557 RepID=A0A1V9ZXW5_9STRA|nr:cell division control protein 45 [Thraustotheca clavata]
MLWPREQFRVAYKQVISDAIDCTGASVLLLVALDADSIAASSILTAILQADMISYSLQPVVGNQQLADTTFAADIRSVFLINCGAMIDIYSTMQLQGTNIKVYVIDSHRPIHLANVYDRHGTVFLFDDEAQAEEEFPQDGPDIEAIEQDEDDEESEAESADDEENDENESKKRKRTESDDSMEGEAEITLDVAVPEPTESNEDLSQTKEDEIINEDGGDIIEGIEESDGVDGVNEGEDNEADDALEKEGSDNELDDEPELEKVPAAKPQGSLKYQRRLEILQYYRGSYYGAPASTILYELATQINQSTPDKVWFAIVGFTKQFLSQQIDAQNYNMFVQKFQDEVLSLNQAVEDVTDIDGTALPSVHGGTIAFEEEYRFLLYRHWSLYNSMYYSNYIAAKLKTWQSAGKDELEVFLARMGLSLKECQQSYTFMSMELKNKLREKLQEIAPEFELDEIMYGSFRRQFEFKYQWCAADVVHGISALLEAPPYLIRKSVEKKIPDILAMDEGVPFWQHSFHIASRALPCKSKRSCTLMEQGIKLAMTMQKAIVSMGISILDRKLIVRIKHFRYVCLRLSEDDEAVFAHPSTLSKLALFLVDVHREQGKWTGKQACPFVLLCHLKTQNVYLIVGVTCPERAGEIHRNKLGTAFKMAAAETGAKYTHDGFDTTVMEIQMDDIQGFIEQLHNRTLVCLIPYVASVCVVEIDGKQSIKELKKLIKQKKSKYIKCDADQLELYEARQRFHWFEWDDDDNESMMDNDFDDYYWSKLVPISSKLHVDAYFDGFHNIPDQVIHVMVRIPDDFIPSRGEDEESESDVESDYEFNSNVNDALKYNMAEMNQTQIQILLSTLGIYLKSVIKKPSTVSAQSVESFKWESIEDKSCIKLCFKYLNEKLSKALDALQLCVYDFSNQKVLLSVNAKEFQLNGGTDIIILHNQVLEFPHDLVNLPGQKLLIEINKSDEVVDNTQVLAKLIALDALRNDESAVALYTNLSNQWDFYLISKTQDKRTIFKTMYSNPTDGLAAIKAILTQCALHNEIELPLVDEKILLCKLTDSKKCCGVPVAKKLPKAKKQKTRHVVDSGEKQRRFIESMGFGNPAMKLLIDCEDDQIDALKNDDLGGEFLDKVVKTSPKLSIEDYLDSLHFMPGKAIHILVRVPDGYTPNKIENSLSDDEDLDSDSEEDSDDSNDSDDSGDSSDTDSSSDSDSGQ